MSEDNIEEGVLDIPPYVREVSAFFVRLAKESERSAVILGAAKLDVDLERLLKQSMRPNSGKQDKLFDADKPLSAFSTKIDLAHRLGLIDEELCSALHLVRKIRNDFAHSIEDASLADPPHKDRLVQLTKLCGKDALPHSSRKKRDSSENRDLGRAGLLWMMTRKVFSEADEPKLNNERLVEFCTAMARIISVTSFAANDAELLKARYKVSLKGSFEGS